MNAIKNALLVFIAIAATTAITSLLWTSRGISTPQSYESGWYHKPVNESLVNSIDREFESVWAERNLQPTERADDLVIARRLALGLTGSVPSIEEIRAFQRYDKSERLNWWVSRLLDDRRFSDYVAERMARAYVGVEDGPFIIYRRRRFVTWLSDQIQENRPYNQLVRTLLTDRGLWTDSPAVNFVTVTTDQNGTEQPDPIRLAGRTSRAFLGMRIDCLQCHDDFLGTINLGESDDPSGGTQMDFHELAAFFGQVQNSLGGIRDNRMAEEYEYVFLDEEDPRNVAPSVPFGNTFLDDSDPNLRRQLANWMTNDDNRPFARAFVNRMWAIMVGRPLVAPVDDIPLFGPYPPALESLTDDFISNGYDIHRLIRVIAGTRVFQMSSRAEFLVTRQHEKHWAVFPLTRLRPEQVAGSVIQSTSLTAIDSTSHIISRLTRFGQETDFVRRYGDAGEDEFFHRGGTVTQKLLLMNGDMVRERIDGFLNAPMQVAQLAPDDEAVVETAYLATLGRQPCDDEQNHFVALLRNKSGNERTDLIKDLYWILINCNEFAWNH